MFFLAVSFFLLSNYRFSLKPDGPFVVKGGWLGARGGLDQNGETDFKVVSKETGVPIPNPDHLGGYLSLGT